MKQNGSFKNCGFIEKKKGEEEEPKAVEDAIKPTRAISAYIYFSNEMVPKIKKDEGISHKQAMSRAGEMWGQIDEAEKAKFNKMHDDDVKR